VQILQMFSFPVETLIFTKVGINVFHKLRFSALEN